MSGFGISIIFGKEYGSGVFNSNGSISSMSFSGVFSFDFIAEEGVDEMVVLSDNGELYVEDV